MHDPKTYTQVGQAFRHHDVASAYRYRPPYPPETFKILLNLITSQPRHILDAGCGRGELARPLAPHVKQVDAVDFSWHMIEEGKQLPDGNHPHLRWLYGAIEDISLHPPYALVIAGQSYHWMAAHIVLPLFHKILLPDGYFAIVSQQITPDPWSILDELVSEYRTDKYTISQNSPDPLEQAIQQGYFHQPDVRLTAPITFQQTIGDFIESYHSRAGFSRERLGNERALAFAQKARIVLQKKYPEGRVALQVEGKVVCLRKSPNQDTSHP